MRDSGYPVNVLHADNDSTTTARLKVDFPALQKKDDKNHTKKGFSKKIYSLAKKFKELKTASVIPYIVRCFTYSISQAKSSQDVREGLEQITPHVFGDHEKCKDWCSYKKDPENFRYCQNISI